MSSTQNVPWLVSLSHGPFYSITMCTCYSPDPLVESLKWGKLLQAYVLSMCKFRQCWQEQGSWKSGYASHCVKLRPLRVCAPQRWGRQSSKPFTQFLLKSQHLHNDFLCTAKKTTLNFSRVAWNYGNVCTILIGFGSSLSPWPPFAVSRWRLIKWR